MAATYSHDLPDKAVLIAGGAKNLGGLLARDFAARGTRAIGIHYNSNATRAAAEETLAAVRALGAEAHAWQADLTSTAAVQRLFAEAKERLGGIDIAINTVGKVLKKPMADTTEAEYDEMFAINSKSAFFFIQQAGLLLNERGKIITLVTSLLGAFTPFYASYAGGKAPVEHFTRAAAKEFGARGISVTAVGPGPMDTPFFYGQESAEAQAYHKSAVAAVGLQQDGPDRHRGRGAADPPPGYRRLVDDGTDGAAKRRLHHQVRKKHSCKRPPDKG